MHFVHTCVLTVSVLLVVLFSVLWFIDYRNGVYEIDTALETVMELHRYNVTLPGAHPDSGLNDSDDYQENRSIFARVILFTVSKDGVIDYQSLYEDYPYLLDYNDIDSIVERTVDVSNDSKNGFVLNGRSYRVNSSKHGTHTDYVFFDWTLERMLSIRSATWFIVAFMFAIWAVGLLAYIHSDRHPRYSPTSVPLQSLEADFRHIYMYE